MELHGELRTADVNLAEMRWWIRTCHLKPQDDQVECSRPSHFRSYPVVNEEMNGVKENLVLVTTRNSDDSRPSKRGFYPGGLGERGGHAVRPIDDDAGENPIWFFEGTVGLFVTGQSAGRIRHCAQKRKLGSKDR